MTKPILTLVEPIPVDRQVYALSKPWEDSITGWLAWLRLSGLATATIRLRRDHIRSIARRSKTLRPAELTRAHLQIICSEHPWSNEHRKALRTSLTSFYVWCIGQGLADDNVALCLPKVRAPLPRPRPTPDDIWDELLAKADPRERLISLLAGEAGLRRAEIAVVHCDDIYHDGQGWALIVHGKGGRQRVVALTDQLAAEIRTYRGSRRSGWLLTGQTSGHISPYYVNELVSKLMPPGWSIHKLRHRAASRGFAGTGNLRAVQEFLGHSSVATTERYVAVSSRDVRLVSDAAGRRALVADGVASVTGGDCA
jgi:integrase